jgi:YD repeat-containing protein
MLSAATFGAKWAIRQGALHYLGHDETPLAHRDKLALFGRRQNAHSLLLRVRLLAARQHSLLSSRPHHPFGEGFRQFNSDASRQQTSEMERVRGKAPVHLCLGIGEKMGPTSADIAVLGRGFGGGQWLPVECRQGPTAGIRDEAMMRLLLAIAFLTVLISPLHAADQSPNQILNGKPAATSSGSGSYYDGNGAFAGRSSQSGTSTRLYDNQGRLAGRVDASRLYDRQGSYAGRGTTLGNTTSFYDGKGAFTGRSVASGGATRFYDGHGAYSGRAETSGGTTRYYDAQGKFVGSRKK